MDYTWAAAGYRGAIRSGKATCGLLMGPTIAIGLRYGRDKENMPMDDMENREKAIQEVNALYRSFIDRFGTSICDELIHCDLGKPEGQQRYMEEKIYKDTCFKFFSFVMNDFIEKDKQETKM
jgi:hypothetical protein